VPLDPRFGITNACMTQRSCFARPLTRSIVSAASATGSGLRVSGDVGTTDSTAAVVAESRKISLR
jgi:hypothetical protein